jgi:hypothetical protein
VVSSPPPVFDPAIAAWLTQHHLSPPDTEHPDWGFKLSMSTVPVSDWTVRRSKVRPDELWLAVNVSRIVGWRVVLYPRDKAFTTTWQSSGAIEVDAQSLQYRARTAWPGLPDLTGLAAMVKETEAVLGRRFLREAELSGPSLKTTDFAFFAEWLNPICDVVLFTLGTVHGDLPAGATDVNDHRKKKSGVSFRLRLADRPTAS